MSIVALSVLERAEPRLGETEPPPVVTPPPGAEPNARRLARGGRGRVEMAGDAALVADLLALAHAQEITIEAVLLAAWALVTSRFTGEAAVTFGLGSPLAALGKSAAGTSLVEGTTVVIDEDAPLAGLLAGAHATLVRKRASHCAAPPAGAPRAGFDTVLRFGGELGGELASSAPLDLSLSVGTSLHVVLAFDAARFRAGMPERVGRALLLVLGDMSARSVAGKVRDLRVVPPDERERLLVSWNATERPFPSERLLHELFEARAREQPDAVAVETASASLSFAELDRAANHVAHALRAAGVLPGARVGVCMPRELNLVVALLGVLKAGAAYVPLDPAYPPERLERIVADAAPALVVTTRALAGRSAARHLVLDASELASMAAEPLPRSAAPDDVCYVIYTSGSTGAPKGVVLQHRAVVNTCDWVSRTFDVGPGDRLLFVTSPSFDLSVYDLFGVLGAGGTVVIAEETLLASPEALVAALVQRDITLWDSAPAALELLAPLFGGGVVSERLRLVLLSGDFIPLRLLAAARAAFPRARLTSLGGATEAAIWSNWFPIRELDPEWVSVPYGRPLQNCRYYVLDARLEPVPLGAVGELYIGGACVAAGYLNRPELTAEKFVPDPFSPTKGQRLYRTGDLVRYFESGDLEILGRADRQVKIRGYRIELGDVEAALRSVPGVEDVACAVRPLGDDLGIAAFLVTQRGYATSEAQVKRALVALLPAYMIPAAVVFLERLPLSPNGKLDRRALPAVDPGQGREVVAPRTEAERRVAAIWQRLLGVSAVGATDDFFELGGHSLVAVRLMNELRRAFALELPLATLLEHRTVEALAARVDAATASAPGAARSTSAPRATAAPAGVPPLHCIGGVGGNPFGIRRLAAELGRDQEVFALTQGGDPTGRDLSAVAREVAEDVGRAQPNGPYYLAGFSAGGVVALEVARLLRARGETVELLVLLDTFNPRLARWTTSERLWLFAQMCRQAGLGYAGARLRARLRFKLELLRRTYGVARGPVDPDDPVAVQAALALVLASYEPQAYDGNVLLLRAAPGSAATVDYRTDAWNGWLGVFSGALHVTTLACRHEDLLRDHAPATAAVLRQALRAARAGAFTQYRSPVPVAAGAPSSP